MLRAACCLPRANERHSNRMDQDRLLLAIDGGQTSTKALLARLDGTVLGSGLGGPSDHFHIEGGVEKNRRAILGAIDDVLTATGYPPEQIVAVAFGLTGAPAGSRAHEIVKEIVNERMSPDQITVVPDMVSNLAGASGGEPGVVLIAGGGSIGYGITTDGTTAVAGGYGYLLGDEGSAFRIGLNAIAAATRAADLRTEPTALQAAVKQHFQIDRERDLPWVVYRAGFSREQISLLAPKVTAAAQAGDAAAIGILRSAGEELALTALGVMRQLFAPGDPVAVYLTGGVFKSGDLLLDPLRTRLQQDWPEAEPRMPRFPPAVGALILAARSMDLPVDAAWLDRVAATLPTLSSS
jgi:N-acetylglucosamine kinase-like BadF-type ATPase